eukprot:5362388-Prymnesium_polylepis.2
MQQFRAVDALCADRERGTGSRSQGNLRKVKIISKRIGRNHTENPVIKLPKERVERRTKPNRDRAVPCPLLPSTHSLTVTPAQTRTGDLTF